MEHVEHVASALAARLPPRARAFVRRLFTDDFELLVSALLVALGLLVFLLVAGLVSEGDTHDVDARIMLALRDARDPRNAVGPSWVEDGMRDLTALGGNAVLTLGSVAVVGFLLIRRQHHAAVLVVVAALGGVLLMNLLKDHFERPRPSVVPHLVRVASPSFPSGHALTSAVIYLTLASLLARLIRERRVKVYVVAVALALTAVVGFTRVYLGVHYPSDVVAGWAVGLAWAVFCGTVAAWLQRRGTVEKPNETTDQTIARAASEGS
jgi:undecaprenyl-diphosphatase